MLIMEVFQDGRSLGFVVCGEEPALKDGLGVSCRVWCEGEVVPDDLGDVIREFHGPASPAADAKQDGPSKGLAVIAYALGKLPPEVWELGEVMEEVLSLC